MEINMKQNMKKMINFIEILNDKRLIDMILLNDSQEICFRIELRVEEKEQLFILTTVDEQ